MKERDWLSCVLGERLLNHLKGQASNRKLRLFGVACCRRIWGMLSHPRDRAAVEAAEQFADGTLTAQQLEIARAAMPNGCSKTIDYGRGCCFEAVRSVARLPRVDSCWGGMRVVERAAVEAVAHGPEWLAVPINERLEICEALRESEKQAQADLLRDIFGNPFRPLPARTFPAEIVELAQSCYAAFPAVCANYGILADVLDSLGEPVAAAHCRETMHVKGCHVLDWILNKD